MRVFFLIGRVANRPKPVRERPMRKGLRGIADSLTETERGSARSGAARQCVVAAAAKPFHDRRMADERWPELPYAAWKDTRDTLHLWTQIVGKVRLALTPWLNHSWHVTLHVTARGLGTPPIAYQGRYFTIPGTSPCMSPRGVSGRRRS